MKIPNLEKPTSILTNWKLIMSILIVAVIIHVVINYFSVKKVYKYNTDGTMIEDGEIVTEIKNPLTTKK